MQREDVIVRVLVVVSVAALIVAVVSIAAGYLVVAPMGFLAAELAGILGAILWSSMAPAPGRAAVAASEPGSTAGIDPAGSSQPEER